MCYSANSTIPNYTQSHKLRELRAKKIFWKPKFPSFEFWQWVEIHLWIVYFHSPGSCGQSQESVCENKKLLRVKKMYTDVH